MFKIEQYGSTVILMDTDNDDNVVFGRVTESGRTVWEDEGEFYLVENDEMTNRDMEKLLIRSLIDDPANKKNEVVQQFAYLEKNWDINEMKDGHDTVERLGNSLEAFVKDANNKTFSALIKCILDTFNVDMRKVNKDRYAEFLNCCDELYQQNKQ